MTRINNTPRNGAPHPEADATPDAGAQQDHAPEIRLADEDLSDLPALDSAFRRAIDGATVRVEIGGRTLYLTDRPPLDDTIEPHELDAAFADAADEILDPALMNFKNTRDVTDMMNALRREDPEAG